MDESLSELLQKALRGSVEAKLEEGREHQMVKEEEGKAGQTF